MKTEKFKKRRHLGYAAETIISWLKKEIEITGPVVLLLYFKTAVASNCLWNPKVAVLNKLFFLAHYLSIFFLVLYVHTLLPQSPRETSEI